MVLYEFQFHIMVPNPTHLSLPTYPPSILATQPPTGKNLVVEADVYQCVPQYFLLSTLLANVPCNELLVCHEASGFCYWILTETPPRYPVVALSHGDPVVWDL